MALNLLLLLLAACVFAAPTPNSTEILIVAWTDEPKTRGTFSIISTCCVTLGLCVWTAMHPEILVNGNTKIRFKLKLRMSAKALVMPEDILTAARIQFDHARQLHQALVGVAYILEERKKKELAKSELSKPDRTTEQQQPSRGPIGLEQFRGSPDSENTLLGSPDLEKPPLPVEEHRPLEITPVVQDLSKALPQGSSVPDKSKEQTKMSTLSPKTTEEDYRNFLSLRVAYFVVMGGFVDKRNRTVPVTCEQFWRAFVRDPKDLIEKVNYKEIVDKGNASMLAKLIVCFQGGWFLVQLIGRRIAHAPMALLELHVAIHILIAAGIYVLWWGKQLDVNEPIVLDVVFVPRHERENDSQNDSVPWWMMPTPDIDPSQRSKIRVLWERLFPSHYAEDHFQGYLRERAVAQIREIKDSKFVSPPLAKETTSDMTSVKRCRHCADGKRNSIHSNLKPPGGGSRFGAVRDLILRVMPCLGPSGSIGSRIKRFADKTPGAGGKEGGDMEQGTGEGKAGDSKDASAIKVVEKGADKRENEGGEGEGGEEANTRRAKLKDQVKKRHYWRCISTCLFYLCYACLHSIAWNNHFPSATEKWLWRGSCLAIGIVPVVLLIFCFVVSGVEESGLHHDADALQKSQIYMGIILSTVYLAAAGALLVEAFISLRKEDKGIYDKVPVSAYLPHL